MSIFHEMQFRLGGSHIFDPRGASRSTQNRLKTGLRRVQERYKSDAFFVLIFDSFWGRLGVVLGGVLGSKIDPKILHFLTSDGLGRSGFRSCCLMVPRWPQDRSKRAPGGVLGRLGGVLGPLWGVLGCFWFVLRGSWAALGSYWVIFGPSCAVALDL